MNFFDLLRSWFLKAFSIFVNLALDAYSWPIVGGWLGDGFADLADFASECAYAFWEASNWYDDTLELLQDILSWSSIRSLIRSWLTGIEAAISWFNDWWDQVGSRIDAWWYSVRSSVQDMIDANTQGFDELSAAWGDFWDILWPELVNRLENLRGSWDLFVTTVLNTLVSFTWLTTWWNSRLLDIQKLINTAFTLRESFWDGWQDSRDNVLEFFADPWGFLIGKFTDWFLGPEE